MAIVSGEIKWKKSAEQSDVVLTNGGGMISDAIPYNYFPDINGTERTSGLTRYRKLFVKQENANGSGNVQLTLGSAKVYLRNPTAADDYFRIAPATADDDVQDDADGITAWHGVGTLNANVSLGASTIYVDAEAANGFASLASIILFDAANPSTFEIREISSVTWNSLTATIGLASPTEYGWDRAAISFSSPTTITNTTIGKTGIDLGAVNSRTGQFVRIVSGPGAGQIRRIISNTVEVLTVNYAWEATDMPTVGSTVEVIKTIVAQLAPLGNIVASSTSWVETNTHGGTYDEGTYPLLLFPVGTVSDSYTLQFSGSGIVNVLNGQSQTIATGINLATTDVKPANGSSFYFHLNRAGFSSPLSNWTTGDTITFTTKHSAAGFWIKQIVPSNAKAHSGNRWDVGLVGDTA